MEGGRTNTLETRALSFANGLPPSEASSLRAGIEGEGNGLGRLSDETSSDEFFDINSGLGESGICEMCNAEIWSYPDGLTGSLPILGISDCRLCIAGSAFGTLGRVGLRMGTSTSDQLSLFSSRIISPIEGTFVIWFLPGLRGGISSNVSASSSSLLSSKSEIVCTCLKSDVICLANDESRLARAGARGGMGGGGRIDSVETIASGNCTAGSTVYTGREKRVGGGGGDGIGKGSLSILVLGMRDARGRPVSTYGRVTGCNFSMSAPLTYFLGTLPTVVGL